MPKTYSDLPVQVVKDDAGDFYEFGVMLDGAFVKFASAKVGHVEPLIEQAKSQSAQSQPSGDDEPNQ